MYEIIHVVAPELLAETAHQNLEIEVVDGQPLAAGYYFVLWPTQTRLSRKRGKQYYGPFQTLAQARMIQRSAWALGVVPDEKAIQTVAECRSIVRPPVAPSAPGFSFSNLQRHQETTACAV